MILKKNDRVVCVRDPYTDLTGKNRTGESAIVTAGGEHIVSLKFDDRTTYRCWLVEDGNGKITLRKKIKLPETEPSSLYL